MKFYFSCFLFFVLFVAPCRVVADTLISNYNVITKGVKIGELVWEIKADNKKYENSLLLKSKGLLSSIYKFEGRYFSNGKIENNFFIPESYSHFWKTKKKEKEVKITFIKNKVFALEQQPRESEKQRIDIFKLKNFFDPLTSFINILNNKLSSDTIDGRRIYKMSTMKSLEKDNVKTIYIENYINIWADHKRNDLEKIIFYNNKNSFFPNKIEIYFKGNLFSIYKV